MQRQRWPCAAADIAAPLPCREKPSLLILPLRTETLQEGLEARDLTERLAATLSRMRVAPVSLAHPSRPTCGERTTTSERRRAVLPAGSGDAPR